jgi:AraC-like DNA-binding protein
MEEYDQNRVAQTNERLKAKLLLHLREPGRIHTTIDGLVLFRRDTVNQPENCFYRPTVGVVVQGFKCSMIGNNEYQYGEGHCMVVGVDMPSVNYITAASSDLPFLALSIRLNRYLITQLAAEVQPESKHGCDSYKGVTVAEVSPEILDAFLRLVELLDNRERIPILAPLALREIHYLLLTGPQKESLRLVCTLGTQSNQIAKAISWLRENYKEPLRVGELAERVKMAESTFNRHFRQVTTLSPLQFQKRLRLYEAQRLMLTNDEDAASAALEVGYESATQFNREYKRLFGESPHRDVNRLRLSGVWVENF